MKNQLSKHKDFIRYCGRFFAVGTIYFLLGRLGLTLATLNEHMAPVWPATAVSIGALYCRCLRLWPAIWIAAMAITLSIQTPILVAIAISTGNTLEAVLGVFLLRYFLRREYFSFQTEVVSFTLTSVLAPAVSATIGVSSLWLNHEITSDIFVLSWLTWWAGNVLGALIGVPLVVTFCTFFKLDQFKEIFFDKKLIREFFIIFFAGVLSYVVLAAINSTVLMPVLVYILLWAGFIAGGNAQLFITLIISIQGIWVTSRGYGPFQGGTTNQNIVFLQLFLASLAITALSIRGFKKISALRTAGLVLSVGWIFTWLLFVSFQHYERYRDEARLHSLVADIQGNLRNRAESYEMALRAGAGLMSSVTTPNSKKWKTFYDRLELLNLNSGMSGIGVISKVAKKDLRQFVLAQKKDVGPDFEVRALPGFEAAFEKNQDHYVVRYLESVGFDRRAIGLDIGSERARREAADRAQVLGRTVITSKITLYYSGERKSGFLMLTPYPGGWVFAPLVVEDFFQGVLGRYSTEIAFEMYENNYDDSEVFYSSFKKDSHLRLTNAGYQTELELAQRKFHIHWYKTDRFESSVDTTAAWVGAAGGFLVVMLASLIVGLQSLTAQANLLAEKKTQKLKEIEKDLTHQTNFLQTVFDHLPVALFTKDPKRDYRFTLWNRMSESIFHLPREKVINKTTFDISNREHAQAVKVEDERVIASRQVLDIPEHHISVPGYPKKVLHTVKVPIYDEQGEADILLGMCVDITDLKESQKAVEEHRTKLIQSAKMSTLGEMAGGIAHEINNPLAIISASTFQLRRVIESLGNEADRVSYGRTLEKIDRTVARISKIVRGLRSFSRNSDGDPFESVNLNLIIGDTLEFCSEKFKFHSVELIVSISENIVLKCRASQISQVLLNFLTNSFDAVKDTSHAWVKVEAAIEDRMAVISITDSGVGIPPQIREKIFQPFFSTKEVGKGTGLGLSISKGIVEDHGGTLELDTHSPNTRFVVRLPLA